MFLKKSKIKGFSLAEVVVSLGVTATVMVIAISLTSQSLRLAKENEIENTANEILVQSLELIKSPVPLNIASSITGPNAEAALEGSYSIASLPSQPQGGVNADTGSYYLKPSTPSITEIRGDSCTQGTAEFSLYKVDLQNSELVLCNQVILDSVAGETGTYFVISIVVYEIGGEKVVDRAEAFRKANFNIVVP